MLTTAHASDNASPLSRSPASPLNVTPVQAVRIETWRSREEALRARDEHKAALRSEFAGCKLLWLASHAGCSEQWVSRCLDPAKRDKFTKKQIEAIRAALYGAEARAA